MIKDLRSIIRENRAPILKKWLGEIFETYPADTARFLRSESDRFANPVGHTVSVNAGHILDGLIESADAAALSEYMEQVIRIRAVQDFTPAGAVYFIGSLKTVIAAQLRTEISRRGLQDEWRTLEAHIDSLTARAYQLHDEMKQKIDDIRAKEADRSELIFKRLTGCRAV